jgi:hypothetical protein
VIVWQEPLACGDRSSAGIIYIYIQAHEKDRERLVVEGDVTTLQGR